MFLNIPHPKHKTKTHQKIQETILSLIPEIEMERRFPEIKRVADLAWHEEKIIFEVQFSQMDAVEARSRNHDYALLGYQVVWILHENSFNPLRPTPFQQFLDYFPHYYTNIDDLMGGDIFDIHLHRKFNVNLTKPRINTFKSNVQKRSSWKIHFEGDYLSTCGNKLESDYRRRWVTWIRSRLS